MLVPKLAFFTLGMAVTVHGAEIAPFHATAGAISASIDGSTIQLSRGFKVSMPLGSMVSVESMTLTASPPGGVNQPQKLETSKVTIRLKDAELSSDRATLRQTDNSLEIAGQNLRIVKIDPSVALIAL